MPRKANKRNLRRFSFNLRIPQDIILLASLMLIFLGFLTIDGVLSAEKNSGFENVRHALGLKEIATLKGEPVIVSDEFLKNKTTGNPPTQIVIPANNIDIKIIEAPISNGYWETSDVYASHGVGSSNPGTAGNMVIFAHARKGLFYNLKDAKLNEVVYVFTKNRWFSYKISRITSVYPNEVKPILPTKDKELTLYTCTGFADEKRLIVTAKPL